MSVGNLQMDLFNQQALNPSHEIKRQIRLAISESSLSRDEIVDRMNGLAARENMRRTVSKAMLDSWTKDSDPNRVPSAAWLPILCDVLGTLGPVAAVCLPLGCRVIGPDDAKKLAWADAELARRRAARRAKIALEVLEV